MRAWVTQSRATLVAAGRDAHGTWLPRSRRVTLHPSFLAHTDVTRHQRQEGPQCVCNRRVLPGPRHRCCGPTDCPPPASLAQTSPPAPPPPPSSTVAPSVTSRRLHSFPSLPPLLPHPPRARGLDTMPPPAALHNRLSFSFTAAPRHTHAMLSLDCLHSLIRSLRMRCSSPTFTPASR